MFLLLTISLHYFSDSAAELDWDQATESSELLNKIDDINEEDENEDHIDYKYRDKDSIDSKEDVRSVSNLQQLAPMSSISEVTLSSTGFHE